MIKNVERKRSRNKRKLIQKQKKNTWKKGINLKERMRDFF